jgi:hypothetical protein
MRLIALLVFCLLNCGSYAQQSYVYTGHGHYYNVFCHSVKAIKEDYFDKHALPDGFIDSSYLPVNSNHQISIVSGDRSLLFKDSAQYVGYYRQYFYAGVNRDKNWVLIKMKEPFHSYYLLINRVTLHIDTLLGYPQVIGNKIICLQSRYQDGGNLIEVWDVIGEVLVLRTKFSLNRCQLDAYRIALSDANELLIEAQDNKYFKVELPPD